MRAIVSSADGPVLTDIPRPSPGPEEVLVQVKAARSIVPISRC